MDLKQKTIRVLRQLEAESSLLDELKNICDHFGELVASSQSTPGDVVDLVPAEQRLERFSQTAHAVVDRRKKLVTDLSSGKSDDVSIRSFIRQTTGQMREQLEVKRSELIARVYDLKTQITSDSAILFYSFDFYRRIVNGLANYIAEEQPYCENGKSVSHPSGKFIQRTC